MTSLRFRPRQTLVLALMALLISGAAMLTAQPPLDATTAPLPPGKVFDCNDIPKSHDFFLRGAAFRAETRGSMVVEAGQGFTTSDGRVGNQLKVVDVFSNGEVEGLGEVVFSLDQSRGGRGTYTANQVGAPFPGTQRLEFDLTVEIGGHQYASLNQAVVVSTDVESVPPPPGTTYTLAGEVLLENVEDPSADPLILQPGQAAVFQ